jgi:hypothetical protein
MLKLAAAFAILAGAAIQVPPSPHHYAEGQVWEYRIRAGDEGSLLKIQRIETLPNAAANGDGRVYHISVIGVRIGPQRTATELQHLPVSQASLDTSVIRLSGSTASFPSPDEGIAQWREARGGVFTGSIEEIVALVDSSVGRQQ